MSNALIYGNRRNWHKHLQQHRLLQQQLPADLRQLGWQLFLYQQHWHSWHLPSRAHTIGHPTLPPLLAEIRQWSLFLGLLPNDPDAEGLVLERSPSAEIKRFNEFSALQQLILPSPKAYSERNYQHARQPHHH